MLSPHRNGPEKSVAMRVSSLSRATQQIYVKVPSTCISGFSISPEINQPRVHQGAIIMRKAPSALSKALRQDDALTGCTNEADINGDSSDFDSEYSDDSLDDDELASPPSLGSAPIPVPISV